MGQSGIHSVEMVFLILLVFVVLFAILARKLEIPYPIILVIGGLMVSLLPGIPRVTLSPDVVFLIVLPPLLYYAAWNTSWRDFSFNIVSIFMLAFGLVGFTVAGVAWTAPYAFHGFDWRMGFVLGAVVATTDAIAATSIAKRLGLPKRIVDVLEGESLVNDASGLLALEFGVAMVLNGRTPSFGEGFIRLAYLTAGGILAGLLVGVITEWFEHRVEDGPIEITVSILVPYASYLAAEAVHASGVLAVVSCGLYLGRRSSQFFSPSVRLQATAVWDAMVFVLNGLVFVLLGLQLPFVLAEIEGYSLRELILYGAVFSAIVIALRLVWLYPGAAISYVIRRGLLHQNVQMPPGKQIFVVGWTGMRGVVALAAAISLPTFMPDGSGFPQRNLIVFLTFSVILVTLVLQGLTLPPLIRALGLAGAEGRNCEEEEARRLMVEAALAYLTEARERDEGRFAELYDDLEGHYKHRLATVSEESNQDHLLEFARMRGLKHELVNIERRTVVGLRDQRRISDEVLRQLERELDLEEERLGVT
jgi:monovalent cation/hydrogen antiporter